MTNKKYPVLTLCGSTRFQKEFIDAQELYTKKGYIVLSPMAFNIRAYHDNETFMQMFHEMHLQKIDMADEILVVNPDNYIGEHTKQEIAYAIQQNKKVHYLYHTD